MISGEYCVNTTDHWHHTLKMRYKEESIQYGEAKVADHTCGRVCCKPQAMTDYLSNLLSTLGISKIIIVVINDTDTYLLTVYRSIYEPNLTPFMTKTSPTNLLEITILHGVPCSYYIVQKGMIMHQV